MKKLVLLSQLAVFKDICPGYRIRDTTEPGAKLSKEARRHAPCAMAGLFLTLVTQNLRQVKQLRDYETRLLAQYQYYLQVRTA